MNMKIRKNERIFWICSLVEELLEFTVKYEKSMKLLHKWTLDKKKKGAFLDR